MIKRIGAFVSFGPSAQAPRLNVSAGDIACPVCFRFALAQPSPCGDERRADVLVDVLFLGIVNPHKRFDGFDDSLRVPDQVAVDVLRTEPIDQATQQSRHVQDLAMGAAHGEKAVPFRKDV